MVFLVWRHTLLTRVFLCFQNSNIDSSTPRTAEHEIKVRFAREFADVGSVVTENHGCTTPESLSSASSFRSLSSTVSSVKSSSGICVDSTPNTPDDVADTSYVNSNIPGVEDLILACADINLGSDSQDLSQDQTFASAIDETSFHASDSSVDESLSDNIGDETRVIVNSNSQLQETTVCALLNETCVLESPDNALSVEHTRSVSPISAERLHAPRVEESFEKPVPLQEDDSVASEPETCAVQSNVVEDSPPGDKVVNNDQLNVTINVSLHNSTSDVDTVVLGEEQTIESYRSTETSSPEKFVGPRAEISVPSASPLVQYAKDPCSPGISNVSSPLEDTNSESPENIVHDVPESEIRSTSPTLLSTFDNTDKESGFALPRIQANSPVIEAEKNEIVKQSDLPRLDDYAVADNEAGDNAQLLNRTDIVEPKASEVSLGTSFEKRDTEIKNIAAPIATTSLFKDVAVRDDETRVLEERRNSSETKIVESAAAASGAAKKKETSFEEFDRTLTLQEIENINLTPDDEQYDEFKPPRQSTTLSCLIKEQPDFEDLISTAEQVTNELLDPSTEFTEETEQFVSATSESKYESRVSLDVR